MKSSVKEKLIIRIMIFTRLQEMFTVMYSNVLKTVESIFPANTNCLNTKAVMPHSMKKN